MIPDGDLHHQIPNWTVMSALEIGFVAFVCDVHWWPLVMTPRNCGVEAWNYGSAAAGAGGEGFRRHLLFFFFTALITQSDGRVGREDCVENGFVGL